MIRISALTNQLMEPSQAIGVKFSHKRQHWYKLGSIRCKHNVRWQHLSQMKDGSFLVSFIFFLLIKTQHTLSGTSAATYKVMKPHCIIL